MPVDGEKAEFVPAPRRVADRPDEVGPYGQYLYQYPRPYPYRTARRIDAVGFQVPYAD